MGGLGRVKGSKRVFERENKGNLKEKSRQDKGANFALSTGSSFSVPVLDLFPFSLFCSSSFSIRWSVREHKKLN